MGLRMRSPAGCRGLLRLNRRANESRQGTDRPPNRSPRS